MVKIQILYKFISRLSKKERLILYIAAAFFLLIVLERLIIYPISSKMNSLDKEIKEKETNIRKDLLILSQKERILKERAQYGSFLSKSKSEQEDMASFLKEVESIANKSSLYILDMKPAGVKEDERKTKKYMLNLSCEGQMEQIMTFMYNIEDSNRLLTIERYQISPKSKASSVISCSISISKMILP